MHKFLKQAGFAVASASTALIGWTSCSAGLFDGLSLKQKEECVLPRRAPATDCTFGYFSTSWRPWNTCCTQPEYETTKSRLPVYDPGSESSRGAPYESLPLQLPRDPSSGTTLPHDPIVAPTPTGESSIPIPNANSLPAPFDPDPTLPLPPIHESNRKPIPITEPILPERPPGLITPSTTLPDPIDPPPPAPLPSTSPGTTTIDIPDPIVPPSNVPPAPGTSAFLQMQPMPGSLLLQPTAYSAPAGRTHRRTTSTRPKPPGEWRVMQKFYQSQPQRFRPVR